MTRGVVKGDYIYYEANGYRIRAKINPLPEEDLNVKASLQLGRFIFGEVSVEKLEESS